MQVSSVAKEDKNIEEIEDFEVSGAAEIEASRDVRRPSQPKPDPGAGGGADELLRAAATAAIGEGDFDRARAILDLLAPRPAATVLALRRPVTR